MNPGRILPSAEPFYFPGGRTGCLLVHGFTGTPKEMRPLGEYLAERGYTALGIRLTGHATQPADMLRARWEDWLADVETGWWLLAGCCERVYAIGLSMGGMLALIHASRFPLAGVVALSALHNLPNDWRLPYAEHFSRLIPTVAKGESDWFDDEARRTHAEYPYYPTRAVAELRDLLSAMRLALPKVTVPVLLVNSRDDEWFRQADDHAQPILDALGSREKSRVWIEGSGHVITRDIQKLKVFQIVERFLEKQEAAERQNNRGNP